MAKNTARGVRFLLRVNMYLCLAQCDQVYLFLVLSLFSTSSSLSLIEIRQLEPGHKQ